MLNITVCLPSRNCQIAVSVKVDLGGVEPPSEQRTSHTLRFERMWSWNSQRFNKSNRMTLTLYFDPLQHPLFCQLSILSTFCIFLVEHIGDRPKRSI